MASVLRKKAIVIEVETTLSHRDLWREVSEELALGGATRVVGIRVEQIDDGVRPCSTN